MPEGWRPRRVTPRPRPDAAAKSAMLGQRRNGQEELPHIRGRGGNEKSYPASEVRGSGWEDQPHFQGAVAVRAQEGLEELSHVEGQERRR